MEEFEQQASWQGQGPASVESRRRILRSMAAGGAAVGAPSMALAASRPRCRKDNKNYHPTASAVGSILGSVTGSTPAMYGNGCSHYTSSSNWGSGWSNGKSRSLTYDRCANPNGSTKLRFYEAFELSNPGSGSPKYRECQAIIRSYPTSDEAIWLTALFNANKVASLFPYTPKGVLDLYNNKNPLTGGSTVVGLHAKAITLFRDYLSLGNLS
jgi:hypothetical protein